MSQQEVFRFVSTLLPSWRKTRRRVLSLGAQGLLVKRRLTLTSLARGMESPCRVIHRVKRLWRFTNNSAVDPRDATQALTQQAFRTCAGRRVPVIMDETGVKDRAMLLGAAVSYRGRALPLGLFAYSPQLIRKSLWALRLGLLAVILQALCYLMPPKYFITIIKDIMLKGNGFIYVWKETVILALFTVVFILTSIKKFKIRLA